MNKTIACIFLCLYTSFCHSDNVVGQDKYSSFSVLLGVSRLIYLADSKGAILPVINEHDYPILVQTKVTADEELDKNISARFSAIPPLFRLDSQQRAKVRIVQTAGNIPHDRESLYWVCVKGIPPKSKDNWADKKVPDMAMINVQVMVNNCIKLLVRPNALAEHSVLSMAEKLTWTKSSKGLTAVNDTPLYINLSMVRVGGKKVDNVRHIAPFSEYTFILPKGANGSVEWRALSDLGGEGPLLTAIIN